MSAALVVSLSGIRDDTLLDAARFTSALGDRGIRPPLLVAPYQGRDCSLRDSPAVLDWIRHRRADGCELLLAGFDQTARGRKGEFAALGAHEARLRLAAATRQMRALGIDADMFAPPKWLLSPGTLEVLPDVGFRVAADLHGVHDLVTGEVDPTRVLAMGEGFGAARWWRRAIGGSVDRATEAGRSIRLSASASKLADGKVRREMLRIIDEALDAGARPGGYERVPLSLAA